MHYKNIIIFLVSMVISYISLPFFLNLLKSQQTMRLNFKKEKVPIGMGLVFALNQSLICFLFSFLFKYDSELINSYIIFMLLIALIGLVDDLIGDNEYKGLKGHISGLLKGTLTTGGLKAIVGLASSFLISVIVSDSLFEILLNTFLIVLFTNLINLFDLRPGRAIKVYVLFSITLIALAFTNIVALIMYSSLGIVLSLFPYDIKAKGMMGDIGSNTLGLTLGFFCGVSVPNNIKIVYLIGLILLHIVAELTSFSKIISKNRILNYIDHLGR